MPKLVPSLMVGLLLVAKASAQVEYVALPDHSFRAVGADGGRAFGVSGLLPALWTRGSGVQMLSVPPGTNRAFFSMMGMSWDGRHLACTLYIGNSDSQSVALWNDLVRVDVGDIPGGGFPRPRAAESGMCGAGNFVIGAGRSEEGLEAFRWSESTGFVRTGTLDGAGVQAFAASYDAGVLCGFAVAGAGTRPWRWTDAGGHQLLASLGASGVIRACSADGRIMVGSSGVNNLYTAQRGVIWNGTGTLFELPQVNGEFVESCTGVSADGRVVVGYTQSDKGIIWDVSSGVRLLRDVAIEQGGVAIPEIGPARAISADGRTIVGDGFILRLVSPCAGDVDDGSLSGGRDNVVSPDDLLAFIEWLVEGNGLADIDNGTGTGTPDAAVNIDDLLYFLQGYEGGC